MLVEINTKIVFQVKIYCCFSSMNEINSMMHSMMHSMMQEDRYVSQLRAYANLLIDYAKEEAFKYLFINYAEKCVTFEQMSRTVLDLIDNQIQSNEEIKIPKISVIPNNDKCERWKEWIYLYNLLITFYVYQFHIMFLLHDFHPKALDTEEFIQLELQNLEIPDEILEKNETALMIANSKEKFQKNKQKGLTWLQTICKN